MNIVIKNMEDFRREAAVLGFQLIPRHQLKVRKEDLEPLTHLSVEAASKKLGVSHCAVKNAIKRYGLKWHIGKGGRLKNPISEIDIEVVNLHLSGVSFRRIAERVEVSRSYAHKIVKERSNRVMQELRSRAKAKRE